METIRRLSGTTLLVASHNPGKVREIRELLAPFGMEIVAAAELGLPEPEETGTTFVANAELKALAAARAAGMPALSDDSGFCVDALGGDPGVYSARWAGPGKDFGIAMAKVWEAVQASGSADRGARFACALSLAWPDGHTETVEGEVHGTVVWPPRGGRGFGYDPMFVPAGHEQTFGEVDSEWKHSVSHRADAFAKLVARCFDGGRDG
ncbi:MAG: RdgB/HAM1 family non-canonical purine NTP pyrophosphatase [Thalassobaculum sp.]|uniref:RdgB/HAM1 family non-canonical purine NTP pyrophosphatase n=1 Tax=Thalassobaculum sp. TaxID=2022740 RepID=UPI0032ED1175